MNSIIFKSIAKHKQHSHIISIASRGYVLNSAQSSEGYIDLRSDTVTRPSPKMREALSSAKVGDDCYHDDPTVNRLEKEIAALFGKDEALFVPSGTMSNLISMMVNVRVKGEGAIVGHLSHLYNVERGGMSAIGGIHPIVVDNQPDGTINLKDIENAIPPNNMHLSQPKVIELENSQNVCNGRVIRPAYVDQVKPIADAHNLRMHLDAARGLNAAVFLGITPKEMVKHFNTVNFCMSKGMGCPVGSLVIGSHADIDHARIIRKMLGGQMRQIGVLAACGLVSLEDWQTCLQNDHDHAKWLATEMSSIPNIVGIVPAHVETNIFRFQLRQEYLTEKGLDHAGFSALLRKDHGILMNASFGNDAIRIVTHRDVSTQQLEKVLKTFKKLLQ